MNQQNVNSHVPLLAGLPQVAAFIDSLPQVWDPADELSKTAFAFTAEGKMDVIIAHAIGGDGDAQADAVAAAVIAYAKTCRPTAVVIVSEGFTWTEDVDNPKRTEKFRSAREAMPGKQEMLLAFIETPAGHALVSWPIFPGPPRWLGGMNISDVPDFTGRFSYLLCKKHIHDRAVKAPGSKTPLRPMPLEQLQARYPFALTSQTTGADRAIDRQTLADHMFAFLDGIRLHVSIEHLEVSGMAVTLFAHGQPILESEMETILLERFNLLSGEQRTAAEIVFRFEKAKRMGCYTVVFPVSLGGVA